MQTLNALLLFVLLLQTSVKSESDPLTLEFVSTEKIESIDAEIKFDPRISWDQNKKSYKTYYRFLFRLFKSNNGKLSEQTYGTSNIELMNIVCKLKDFNDGDFMEIKSLISFRRNGSNIIVKFHKDGGILTPMETRIPLEDAVEFSKKVNHKVNFIHSNFHTENSNQ